MWKVISFTKVYIGLKPYLGDYVLAIVEDKQGKRAIAQVDSQVINPTINQKGSLKTIIGPNGSINIFSPNQKEEKRLLIKTVGIIGAGEIGLQLTQLLLNYGFKVIIKSRNKITLSKIKKTLTPVELKQVRLTTNYKDLKQADLVIETVKENKKIKTELFNKLEKSVKKTAILATNTSSLLINELAKELINPDRFLGIHFFNPIKKMPLIELIKSKKTSLEVIELIKLFADKICKKPILVDDNPGFVVNRLLFGLINEAAYLLEENIAKVTEIDQAMKLGANFPMGPFELADFIGIDLCYEIIKNISKKIDGFRPPAPIFLKMLKAGKIGRKTKSGFYQY